MSPPDAINPSKTDDAKPVDVKPVRRTSGEMLLDLRLEAEKRKSGSTTPPPGDVDFILQVGEILVRRIDEATGRNTSQIDEERQVNLRQAKDLADVITRVGQLETTLEAKIEEASKATAKATTDGTVEVKADINKSIDLVSNQFGKRVPILVGIIMVVGRILESVLPDVLHWLSK